MNPEMTVDLGPLGALAAIVVVGSFIWIVWSDKQ